MNEIFSYIRCMKAALYSLHKVWWNESQSVVNLCTTTTLGTLNIWPLLTGGRCLEVAYVII